MKSRTRNPVPLLGACLLLACSESESPDPVAEPASPALPAPSVAFDDAISAERLMEHIVILASDEFGGRAPMTDGERLTLDYLETQFHELGLEPMFGDSYRQAVPLVSIAADPDMPLRVRSGTGEGERLYAYGSEVMMWTPRVVEQTGLEDSELVWVGYGIVAPEYDWNDYAGADVSGKTVVMLVNDPGFATGNPDVFNGRRMTYYGRWTYKFEEAARQGAAGVLLVHQTAPAAYGWNVVEDGGKGPQFHLMSEDNNRGRAAVEGWVRLRVAEEILALAGQEFAALEAAAAQGSRPPLPLGLFASVSVRNTLNFAESYNVGAVVPGAQRPDELFLYMAHWDHMGTAAHTPGESGDFIYNGAEDNASGTSGLLEIGKAFSNIKPAPARSIGLLAVTAEESGLLGSLAYAKQPAWPLWRTVGGINMDRLNFRGLMQDVEVIGHGSSELEVVLAEVAREFGRSITPEATPEKGFYYRSDHFNFAKRGVPILYARGGTVDREHGAESVARRNADYIANRYHAPADEIQDDWVVEAAVEDLQLFFRIGLSVANSEDWPEWYEGNEFRAIREASLATGPGD